MNQNITSRRLALFFSRHTIYVWMKTKIKHARHARMIAQQRKVLAQLDSAQLRDIGISRDQANKESARGFWDLPDNLP